jgi:iron complex outermembrane recepter protein
VIETELVGESDVMAETLNAYEIGYRAELLSNLSVDLATFYNVYDHVIEDDTLGMPELETDPEPEHVVLPIEVGDGDAGDTYGGELSVQWKPVEWWRLIGSYSLLQVHLHPDNSDARESPQQQAALRSYVNLPWNLQLNSSANYVDSVDALGTVGTIVPIRSYVRLDTGLVWHATKNLELGIWGQNLLSNRHLEGASETSNVITEVPRSIIGKITLRF